MPPQKFALPLLKIWSGYGPVSVIMYEWLVDLQPRYLIIFHTDCYTTKYISKDTKGSRKLLLKLSMIVIVLIVYMCCANSFIYDC
jgi:hypothetical protein